MNLVNPYILSAAGSSLLVDLAAGWQMEESGTADRTDVLGVNDLTVTGTVVSDTTGIIGNGMDVSVSTAPTGVEGASDASLQAGASGFSLSLWVNPTAGLLVGGGGAALSKGQVGDVEYGIAIEDVGSGLRLEMVVSDDGTTFTVVQDTTALSGSTWYHVVAWHDPSGGGTINISVNDNTPSSTAFAGPINASTGNFAIGFLEWGSFNFDGIIDEVYLWQRILTSGERTSLYNSGAGLTYPFV